MDTLPPQPAQTATRLSRLKHFAMRHKLELVLYVVFLLVAGYFVQRSKASSGAGVQYLTAAATKATIVSAVTGSGQIISSNQVDIKPQASGTITRVAVTAGQQVKAGQTLVSIDSRAAVVAVQQAEASLESAQANYQKLLAGTAAPDLDSANTSVQSAENKLAADQKNIATVKAQQDQAVGNALSSLLNTGAAATPGTQNVSNVTITPTGAYTDTAQGSYLITVDTADGQTTKFRYTGLEQGDGYITAAGPVALGSDGLYIQFSSTAVSPADAWTITLPNPRASGYLSAQNNYQTAVLNRQIAEDNAQQAVASDQLALQQALDSLATKQQPPSNADTAAARAQILSAQAQLQSARNTLSNTTVTAPFDGIIASVAAKQGDQASAATSLATIIAPQQLAQVSLNEVDAVKIKLSQKATLTFSAVDSLSLTGSVVYIDTIGTATQGVVNYSVQMLLDANDSRIKPGMSVDASIITDRKADVLAVPNSAIKTQGGQQYVETLAGVPASTSPVSAAQPPKQVTVTAGLASDSMTEITSGLSEGDIVVTQTITPSSATSNTTTGGTNALRATGGFGGGGATFFRATGGAAAGR